MVEPFTFLGKSIVYLVLIISLGSLPCLSLQLNNPSSASEYVEVVAGKAVQVTWKVEAGDPSSFKLKLRNREVSVNGGMWTLSDSVRTSSGQVVVGVPDVPEDSHYYIEADVFDPDMRILSSTLFSQFSIIKPSSAHLKIAATTLSTATTQNTVTQTKEPGTTPTTTPTNAPLPADTMGPVTSLQSITQVLSSTITLSSGISIIGYTITTATAIILTTSSSLEPTLLPGDDSEPEISKKPNIAAILGGSLGAACFIALVLLVILLRRRRRRRAMYSSPLGDGTDSVSPFSEYRSSEGTDLKGHFAPDVDPKSEDRTETSLRQQVQIMSQRIMQLEAQAADTGGNPTVTTSELPPEYTEVIRPKEKGRSLRAVRIN